MADEMPTGIYKKLFISQNRFVEIDLNIKNPKSFTLYDYDLTNKTLSILNFLFPTREIRNLLLKIT